MKTASCPSCGAPVVFRSAASLYVVCDFCRSTLLRSGEDLQNLGRMADLLEDASLIQIGSEGRFRNRPFRVIGRIQLAYEAGVWNEWYILLDDAKGAWLSEAGGEYVVSAQVTVKDPLPAFETLAPEMPVFLDGQHFTVTDLERARCISGQGELPFRVAAGYDVQTADLRSDQRFVTLDYSETPPMVFVGQPVAFADLQWVNLRQASQGEAATRIQAQAFHCPHCAAPLQIHSPAIESIGCDSCGSIIGIANENVQLLARAAQAMRVIPWLPLGSRGKLQEIDWEVIGFMRRGTPLQTDEYSWSEYLLFNSQSGFAWLIEDRGHWNFARTLANPPSIGRQQPYFLRGRQKFKRYNSGRAEVSYVVGEFYWRVAVGETCTVDDYVCPPLMLSREVTDKEVSWSQAEYLEPEAVCTAFAIQSPPPKRHGVYGNQPNPLTATHQRVCRLFWRLAAVATLTQLLFAFFFASQLVLKQSLVFAPDNEEASLTSQEFVLAGRARTLLVSHKTDLTNNWLSLSSALIEKNTGETYVGEQEISYYKGVDDGEGWSEGSQSDEMVFSAIPPGTYYLAIDYELGTDNGMAVADSLEVTRNPAIWSNYILLLIFLAVFPLFSRWRRNAFESHRWQDSDLAETET